MHIMPASTLKYAHFLQYIRDYHRDACPVLVMEEDLPLIAKYHLGLSFWTAGLGRRRRYSERDVDLRHLWTYEQGGRQGKL